MFGIKENQIIGSSTHDVKFPNLKMKERSIFFEKPNNTLWFTFTTGTVGVVYSVMVDGFGGGTCDYSMNVNSMMLPVFSSVALRVRQSFIMYD